MAQGTRAAPQPGPSHAHATYAGPVHGAQAGAAAAQSTSVQAILQHGAERNARFLSQSRRTDFTLTCRAARDPNGAHHRPPALARLDHETELTWLQAGRVAEMMEDAPRALASYDAALRLNPVSVQALFRAAEMHKLAEDHPGAAELYARALAAATTGSPPHSPRSGPSNGHTGQASSYPLNTSDALGEAWGGLAHCYLMTEELGRAYTCYQQAIAHQGSNQPTLWYGIGILYDRYGSLEHAEEAFSTVIRLNSKFEKANEIYFRLGIIYKQQKNSRASLQYILGNPPRPLTEIDIWFQIGHVYEQQQDFDQAKEAYERVLSANPNHAKVLQQLGGLYQRRGAPFYDPDKSVVILTKSLEADGVDAFSWYLLGRAFMTIGNFNKAYEAYQQAVYRDGKNPAFWCSIGVLYYNINQFHDSLDAYSRAIRINPYMSEIWFNLGALYESCNDQMADAIDAYQRTLQLDSSNAAVAQRLEEIMQHQSRGAPLGTPPQPVDISQNSTSWALASNNTGPQPPGNMPGAGTPASQPSQLPAAAHPMPAYQHAPHPVPLQQPMPPMQSNGHASSARPGAAYERPAIPDARSPPLAMRPTLERPVSMTAYSAPPPLSVGPETSRSASSASTQPAPALPSPRGPALSPSLRTTSSVAPDAPDKGKAREGASPTVRSPSNGPSPPVRADERGGNPHSPGLARHPNDSVHTSVKRKPSDGSVPGDPPAYHRQQQPSPHQRSPADMSAKRQRLDGASFAEPAPLPPPPISS